MSDVYTIHTAAQITLVWENEWCLYAAGRYVSFLLKCTTTIFAHSPHRSFCARVSVPTASILCQKEKKYKLQAIYLMTEKKYKRENENERSENARWRCKSMWVRQRKKTYIAKLYDGTGSGTWSPGYYSVCCSRGESPINKYATYFNVRTTKPICSVLITLFSISTTRQRRVLGQITAELRASVEIWKKSDGTRLGKWIQSICRIRDELKQIRCEFY